MSEDLLRQIAATLNQAPDSAGRTARAAALVTDVNARVANEAMSVMPFDATPYAYQAWLATSEKS